MKALLTSLLMMMMWTTSASANQSSALSLEPLRHDSDRCEVYDHNPRRCNAIRGCEYNYRFDDCRRSYQDRPGRGCWEFDGNQWQCERAGCDYDWRTRSCDRDWDGGWDEGNRSCRSYDRSPSLCDNQRHCRYSYHRRACYGRW